MSGTDEVFKAIYAVAIFACLCGMLKLALLDRLAGGIRLVLGSFLALMLLPTTYLYLRLAFPSNAAKLLPLQSMAIWLYGPLLMGVLHLVTNTTVRSWRITAYVLPALCSIAVQATYFSGTRPHPPWWELLSLAQASLFAVIAIVWTLRARAQLRIALRGFSGSSFGPLLYLSAGLLALLLADLFVHWRYYAGLELSPLTFYLLVTPCALYALVISMVLIWRSTIESPVPEELEMPAPETPEPHRHMLASAPDTPPHPQIPTVVPDVPFVCPQIPVTAPEVPVAEPQVQGPVQPTVTSQSRNLGLSPAAARELELHLDVLMREQGLYKRNDLTLADLAAALRVSSHHASELLNAHLKSSFYEFLNRHRAMEAARLLRAGKGKLSVTDIAYQAGFNNPNTFYREFKREYRVTPAQFRRADDATIPLPSASHSTNPEPRV